VHMILGSATAGLYFTTAYFAIRAPRVEKNPADRFAFTKPWHGFTGQG